MAGTCSENRIRHVKMSRVSRAPFMVLIFAVGAIVGCYLTILHSKLVHPTQASSAIWYQPKAQPTAVLRLLRQFRTQQEEHPVLSDQAQTSDNWPNFSKKYFSHPIPRSPFKPDFTIKWDFNISTFLQRPDVKDQPPKIMTWMVKSRYIPPLPEPVRLRVCPEMPCRMTTNKQYQNSSAILIWAVQLMRDRNPPVRSHPNQVYLFHNHEPQVPQWIHQPSFRLPSWRSAFNWTMTYRWDSDIVGLYGYIKKREVPARKDYSQLLRRKSLLAAQLVSNCHAFSRREDYVRQLQEHGVVVDVYGGCSNRRCARSSDSACFQMINEKYKFFLAFESAFCKDYISEKFFRYMGGDFIVVARGSNQYKHHAPAGTFINTADFNSSQELAKYLLHLDKHPEEYLKILKAKDQYQALYEDWPIRTRQGRVTFMTYHYQAVSFCQLCQRLWDLDQHRKTIANINSWFDRHNCYPARDLT